MPAFSSIWQPPSAATCRAGGVQSRGTALRRGSFLSHLWPASQILRLGNGERLRSRRLGVRAVFTCAEYDGGATDEPRAADLSAPPPRGPARRLESVGRTDTGVACARIFSKHAWAATQGDSFFELEDKDVPEARADAPREVSFALGKAARVPTSFPGRHTIPAGGRGALPVLRRRGDPLAGLPAGRAVRPQPRGAGAHAAAAAPAHGERNLLPPPHRFPSQCDGPVSQFVVTDAASFPSRSRRQFLAKAVVSSLEKTSRPNSCGGSLDDPAHEGPGPSSSHTDLPSVTRSLPSALPSAFPPPRPARTASSAPAPRAIGHRTASLPFALCSADAAAAASDRTASSTPNSWRELPLDDLGALSMPGQPVAKPKLEGSGERLVRAPPPPPPPPPPLTCRRHH